MCEVLVQPGLCHSMKTGSLQDSVDKRLEPADHSKVLTSTCQRELQHIDYVYVQVKEQKITYSNNNKGLGNKDGTWTMFKYAMKALT